MMHINVNQASSSGLSTSSTSYLRPTIREPRNHSQSPSVTASISSEAKKLSDGALATDGTSQSDETAELKNYIKSLDFTNISPQEMNNLASKLVESGELSGEQVRMYMGIEQDTVQPKSASEKMNVIDHFSMMYDNVVSAARTDSGFNEGVGFRRESINTFNAIREFAVSDRQHILGGK